MATDVLVNFVQRWLKQAPNHKRAATPASGAAGLPAAPRLLGSRLPSDC